MKQRQKGQSVVGFLVASVFILVPAFIGMTFLAKIGDMKFRVQEASRYAAWEKTVWEAAGGHAKDDTALGWEVRNRVLHIGESTEVIRQAPTLLQVLSIGVEEVWRDVHNRS